MRHIGDFFGIPIQIELFLVIILGITCCILDQSLFLLNAHLNEVWETPLNVEVYPITVQKYIKYTLCGMILVRTLTNHLFLAMYVVILWPILFVDRPNLLLPWLAIGFVRNICLNFISLSLGFYVCWLTKGYHPLCLEFILAQIIDHGPGVYAWFLVLQFYYDVFELEAELSLDSSSSKLADLAERRRRSKLMHFKYNADDGRNLLSESMLETITHHLRKGPYYSRSLDSLLNLKEHEEETEEIMDIKYSDCLSEADLNDHNALEKAMILLEITNDDINRAKEEKESRILSIQSDFTLDAISYEGHRFISVDKKKVRPTVSSESFLVKNGKVFKGNSISWPRLPDRKRVSHDQPTNQLIVLKESSDTNLDEESEMASVK